MKASSEKSVGIKEVASYAGVSISTVSHVLNGTKPVSAALTKRVINAVEKLNYETNLIGRQLKTGKSQQLAVVVPSITSIFFPNLLKSIQTAADQSGYMVSVFSTKGNLDRERHIIRLLHTQGFDGIMLSSCVDVDLPETAEYLEFLHSINFAANPTHIICLEAPISTRLDAVVANDEGGMKKVTEYLIRQGHRNFAHISAPVSYMMGKFRKQGFLTALMLNGIPINEKLIVEGEYTCVSGYKAMKQLLDTGLPIDAVVAGNDQMAIGAINCLKQQGISVPQEIAIAGFNDNTPASLISPSLTTFHVPKAEMGFSAFDLFMKRVHKDTSAPKLVQLVGELVIRNSTDPDVVTSWDMEW